MGCVCPLAREEASFGGCWGPGPVQRRSSSCYPLVSAVSHLSPLFSWGLGETQKAVSGTGASRLAPPLPGIPLTFPQVRLRLWELWTQWVSPAGPGCEPGLPPVSAGEWRGRCPQGTWAWGGGSGLGSWESGQLSVQGPFKATGKAKRYSPSPGPKACPPGWQGRGPERIRREWVGSRQVRRRSEAEPADEAAPSS